MKIDKTNAKHWVLLASQGLFALLIVLVRPFRKKPGKPVVVLYGHQFSGNLKALYTQWEITHQDQLSLYFLTLDPQYAEELQKNGIRMLRCSRLRDMLMLSRANAMITDHGLHAMEPLVRFTDIKFIDVWHGIPFKGFTPDDFNLQHRYDEVWVSSPQLKRMYVERFGFNDEQVLDLGYARTDQLFNRSSINDQLSLNTPEGMRLVLYAPTWRQDDAGRELFPFGTAGEAFISALAATCAENNAVLAIRSHLNARIDQTTHSHVMFCPQSEYPDSEQLLLQADVLICDWSSIAFDFLALQRPTLFLDVPAPFANGFSLDGSYRFGDVVGSMQELQDILHECLADPNHYEKRNSRRIAKITGVAYGKFTDGRSADRQLRRLQRLAI